MQGLRLRQVQDAFAGPLQDFVRESGVRLAVLINRSGQVLAQLGFEKVLDLVGVASLAAGINASSRVIEALGLRRHQMTVVHNDTPAIRGMLHKVRHLVRVEEVK